MWQDKENLNTGQCFTPKKSLRDIFSSISNSKSASPQKKSPGRRVDKSRVLTPINLNILPPSSTSSSRPPSTPKYNHNNDNSDALNDSFFANKMDLDTTFDNIPVTPGRTSIANYSFSYFHLQPDLIPPPSPMNTTTTNNNPINTNTNNITRLDTTNISKISDMSSDISDNSSDISDHTESLPPPIQSKPLPFSSSSSSSSSITSHVPPKAAAINPLLQRVVPLPTYTSSSSFASSTLPKSEVKFATPTKMRVPKPKTSAWAHSPFHKTPSKHVSMQSSYAEQEQLKAQVNNGGLIVNLGGKFDEIMAQTEDLLSQPLCIPTVPVPPVELKTQIPKPSLPTSSISSSSSFSSIPQPKPVPAFQLPTETKQALINLESSFQFPSSKPLPSFPLSSEPTTTSIATTTSFLFPPSKPLQSFPLEEVKQKDKEKEKEEEEEKPMFQVPSLPSTKAAVPSDPKRESILETSFSLTRKSTSSSIPKPTSEKGKSELPRKAITKSKSSVDLDSSFQLPSKKPKQSVDPLNTSLQLPKKVSISNNVSKTTKPAATEKTGIRRPSAITPSSSSSSSTSITPKNEASQIRVKPATAPRPSLSSLSSTTPKKRSAVEMETSFSSSSSVSLSSTTPKRKPRPSEIMRLDTSFSNSLTTPTSSIPSISSSSSSSSSSAKPTLPRTTPKKYSVSSSGYGIAKPSSSSSSIPSSSSSSTSVVEAPSRIPVSKKSKSSEIISPRSAEEEFELKLEMALQAGNAGGANSLPRTPTMGKREAPSHNKWSPVRKRALTFEESVLACTKKTKNEL